MPDFTVRSDSVNVEQIMEQIRARIREKRGADYTEQQIQDMANVKLEKFLDPRGVRSDLLDQFRRAQPPYTPPDLPNYAFEEQTLFESHRAPLRLLRKLFNPLLKLFFNPNPLIQALNIQSRLNTMHAEREARNEAARHTFDSLHYEVLHNLVVETTRMGIEVKNLKMKVESLTSRLEFNERRARALESAVVYKPAPEERVEPPAVHMPPPREPREPRERSERRDGRDPQRDSRGPRESREPRDQREAREPREAREQREPREARELPPATERPAETATPAAQDATVAPTPTAPVTAAEGPGQRSRRRRRRRGRRGGGSAAALLGGAAGDPSVGGNDQPQFSDAHGGDDDSSSADMGETDGPSDGGSDDSGSPDHES